MTKIKDLKDVVFSRFNIDKRKSLKNGLFLLLIICLGTVFFWSISQFGGHIITQFLQSLDAKPDFYATLGQIDKDINGHFIQLELYNNGATDINDVYIHVWTCYQVKPLSLHVSKLISGQKYSKKIRDTQIIKYLTTKQCALDFPVVTERCPLDLYTTPEGVQIVLPTICTNWLCGSCPYNITIESEAITKTVNSSFLSPFPQELLLYTTPKTEPNENLTYIRTIYQEMSWSTEDCIKRKDCVYVETESGFYPVLTEKLESAFLNGTYVIEPLSSDIQIIDG